MLPCRDPIGLSGFRHALHLGLPFELPPDVHTMEEAAALLRKRGTVLVDEGEEGEQLLLALLGKPRDVQPSSCPGFAATLARVYR